MDISTGSTTGTSPVMSSHITKRLISAAQDSLVSDTTGTSTFEKMLLVACDLLPSMFESEIRDVEKQFKQDFELTYMPNPWRSAKSVISTCLKANIELKDDNDSPYGKTFLQRKIKELREHEELTTEMYVVRIMKMITYPPKGFDRKIVTDQVKASLTGII